MMAGLAGLEGPLVRLAEKVCGGSRWGFALRFTERVGLILGMVLSHAPPTIKSLYRDFRTKFLR